MNPAYLPKTREAKLARLTEEAAEVILELGKIGRFGLDTRFSFELMSVVGDPAVESNREALLRELADLEDAIRAVREDLARP